MRTAVAAIFLWMAFSGPVFGEGGYGDWYWSKSGGVFIAGTDSGSGQSFGQFCSTESGNCLYTTRLDLTCEKESKLPVLVNSEIGAEQLYVICSDMINDSGTLLVFTDFDIIDNIVRKATTLGLAFAMESGQFSVSRFSLSGSVKALNAMLEEAEGVMNEIGIGDLRAKELL